METDPQTSEFDLGFDVGGEPESEPEVQPGSEGSEDSEPAPQAAGDQPDAAEGPASDAVSAEPAPSGIPGLTPEQMLLYEKARLEGEVNALRAAAPQIAPQPAQQAPQEPGSREWNLQVPDQLVAGLSDEDPAVRKQAITALVNGVAQVAYKYAIEDAQRFAREHSEQYLQGYVATQMERARIYNDFYGTYPELAKPEFQAVVRAIGDQVAREIQATEWSPRLRDLIGARARAVLRVEQAQPAAPPAPQKKPNPLPKTVVGNTRPSPAPSAADEISEFLGL